MFPTDTTTVHKENIACIAGIYT